jgi:hypothetical protein
MRPDPKIRRNRRIVLLLAAGAAGVAALPALSMGQPYGYFVSQQLTATGIPYSGESADLGRVDLATGTVQRTFVPAADFVTASGGGLPFTIAMNDSSRLAAAGDYIYWSSKDTPNEAIGRLSKLGGNIQPNWLPLPGVMPRSVAVGSNAVFFSYFDYVNTTRGIGKVNLDGTGLDMNVVQSQDQIFAIAVDGNTLYWINDANGRWNLMRCTIGSCGSPTLVGDIGDNTLGDSMRNSLSISSTTAYVTTSFGQVGAFDLTRSFPATVSPMFFPYYSCGTFAGNWSVVTTDSSYAYVVGDSNPGSASYVCRRPLNAAPGAPGTDWATIYTAGENSVGLMSDSFTIAAPGPPPSITSVAPATGTTAGGTTVTITGTNFTGATAVTFAGTAASSFTVNSATQITAVTPARSAGTADVVVTTPDGTDTEAGAFLYQAPTPPAPPAPPATPATPAAGNTQTPTSAWVPPSGPEDKAILINDARVDLAAAPVVTTQGSDTTVVTNMTVDEVGRYTVMYIAPKRAGNAIGEMASATERVSFAKGTVINKRKLKRKYTAVTFTTTKQGAQVTMRALLKRAKGRKLTLRVIYKAADGTLKESRIKS